MIDAKDIQQRRDCTERNSLNRMRQPDLLIHNTCCRKESTGIVKSLPCIGDSM